MQLGVGYGDTQDLSHFGHLAALCRAAHTCACDRVKRSGKTLPQMMRSAPVRTLPCAAIHAAALTSALSVHLRPKA